MSQQNVLIYLLRRDLRVEDNPIFHEISNSKSSHGFTHLLPVYVFAAQQMQVSGFIPSNSSAKYPYPDARSDVGKFWRCGPHRAKFLGESVWDLKEKLKEVGSDLELRVGMAGEVIENLLEGFAKNNDFKVGGVWMTNEEGVEEKREERAVKQICGKNGVDFKLFLDEKYFIDDRDLPFEDPRELDDVFTSYRKKVEPLRDAPRAVLPMPSSILPLPEQSSIPPQHEPFEIPTTLDDLQKALLAPIALETILPNSPPTPRNTPSAHPFIGGSKTGHQRIHHLLTSGSMTSYKDTRNGLLGTDFSTKLSGWLALGSITARQIHKALLSFENGTLSSDGDTDWSSVPGYNEGETPGSKAVRFELLWRDYMRLCTRKFGPKLFDISGFRGSTSTNTNWRSPSSDKEAQEALTRLLAGTTGMGLIDASQRELFLTGYTSNRARQNVASFVAKHLNLDWRLGAEWYECMLVDYDVSSNWGNWQYVAGVGNDPRGEARVFNPVKQGWDYDSRGEYVLGWVKELDDANRVALKLNGDGAPIGQENPETQSTNNSTTSQEQDNAGAGLRVAEILQAWEVPPEKRKEVGLDGVEFVERPLKRIVFTVGKKAPSRNPRHNSNNAGRGSGRGGPNSTGGERGMGRSGGYSASRGGGGRGGYGNARYGSGGGGGYNGRGYGGGGGSGRRGGGGGNGASWNAMGGAGWGSSHGGGAGRQGRVGMMERAGQRMDGGMEA